VTTLRDPDVQRRAYTVDEAARSLGVHKQTIYEAIRRGDIRSVTLGRRLLMSRQALDDFLKEREHGHHRP
jgi:excisionase family DNA binding protein